MSVTALPVQLAPHSMARNPKRTASASNNQSIPVVFPLSYSSLYSSLIQSSLYVRLVASCSPETSSGLHLQEGSYGHRRPLHSLCPFVVSYYMPLHIYRVVSQCYVVRFEFFLNVEEGQVRSWAYLFLRENPARYSRGVSCSY